MAEIVLGGKVIDRLLEVLNLLHSRLTPPPPPRIVTSIQIKFGTSQEISSWQCSSGEDFPKWLKDRESEIVNVVRELLGITGTAVMSPNAVTPSLWMLDGKSMSTYVQFDLGNRTDPRMATRSGFRVCWSEGIPEPQADGYARQIRDLLGLDTKTTR